MTLNLFFLIKKGREKIKEISHFQGKIEQAFFLKKKDNTIEVKIFLGKKTLGHNIENFQMQSFRLDPW